MSTKFLWIICSSIMCILLLTGCKDTDVLKEIVYRQDQEQIDHSQQMVDNEEQNTQEDETLYSQKEKEKSKQKRDTKDSVGVENSTADTTPSASVNPGEETTATSDSSVAKKKTSSSESDSDHQVTDKSKNDSVDDSDENLDFDSNKASVDDGENHGEDDGSSDIPSSNGDGQMTDANGKHIDVPERVDTVTAVGETAPIVEMLGGCGRLAGSSESFTDNNLVKQVFSDASNVKKWWDGTGENSISASSFHQLIEAAPQVCFVVSNNSFTTGQKAALAKHNITCVTLYPYNTPEHIEWNVTLIGQILGDMSLENGKKDAVSVAKKYVSWIKSVESDFNGDHFTDYTLTKYLAGNSDTWNIQGRGKYTLLVQHWDENALVEIYSNKSQGFIEKWNGGAGASDSGYTESPVSYYMSIAGVVNSAAAVSSIEKLVDTYTWYVNQWTNGSCIVKISGAYNSYRASGNSDGPLLAEVLRDKINTNDKAHLGDSNFPAIIAGSKTIADNLSQTKLMSTAFYQLSSGGFQYSSRLVMRTSIMGDYSVYVNPYGVSCWYEGSIEAPLETYWIAAKLNMGSYDMSDVEDKIKYFYKTFYDYDLSNSQVEDILDGENVPSYREE